MNMSYTKTLAFLAFSTIIVGIIKNISHCMDNKRSQMTSSPRTTKKYTHQ